jgi:hypothetical protein
MGSARAEESSHMMAQKPADPDSKSSSSWRQIQTQSRRLGCGAKFR